ncbi:hypothetical protein QVD17_40280 [Tagetes erecta]|uniref:endo-polygalacturonase n=1 Tax=Tagetes erecta TaxID=13708 RepID=A0AAD8JTP9_TARER|nr:hypothetical protein QVD17_40280 [Tagetes erecta]
MASQKHITCFSFVIVLVFFCLSCYSFTYHEHVHSYMSRAYTCCIKTAIDYMFQDPSLTYGLALVSTKTFDVDSFGAKGDGKKDDTNAFNKAWKEACSSTTAAVFSVAKNKKYLVTPIRFEGPCKASLTMQISGIILASKQESKYKKDEKHWLRVDKVDDLVMEGGGVIDGNGDIWWTNSCKVKKSVPCKDAPTALTFYKCTSLTVSNVTVQNAQKIHVSFDNCDDVQVSKIQVTAPEDSPNTDGIHVTHTTNIRISDSVIGTGDDCISIVNGSKNVQATGITCGPGHGISIGSLGSKNSEAHVSGVLVDRAKLNGTTNGVRIKTWQGGSGNATNITFQNINMMNVTNPIIIDQYYCDQAKPCKEQGSAVEIKKVTYKNITGTSASKDAVIFKCSKKHPCEDIVLKDINLTQEDNDDAKAICNNVDPIYIGTVIPRCPENIVQDQSTTLETYTSELVGFARDVKLSGLGASWVWIGPVCARSTRECPRFHSRSISLHLSPAHQTFKQSTMAERGGERGGFGRGFGGRGRGGDRGRGRRRAGRRDAEEEKWVPVTKLGRLVKDGKITKLEEIYLHSLPVKEHQIVDQILPSLKDEVMKIMPVQKQTRAGQRTRFKAFVVVGDGNGHVGLGVKCAKEVATAIRGAIILAKLSVIPVRRGYWGNKIGKVHTVPTKVTGKCGSVTVRLVPAPRGAGIVAARVPKKVLQFAGIDDVFTSSRGSTKTLGNFVKATFDCLLKTYGFLTPDFWRETRFSRSPFQEYTDLLAKPTTKVITYVEDVADIPA